VSRSEGFDGDRKCWEIILFVASQNEMNIAMVNVLAGEFVACFTVRPRLSLLGCEESPELPENTQWFVFIN